MAAKYTNTNTKINKTYKEREATMSSRWQKIIGVGGNYGIVTVSRIFLLQPAQRAKKITSRAATAWASDPRSTLDNPCFVKCTVLLFIYCILYSNNPIANSSRWHLSTIISEQFSSSSHIRITPTVHFDAPYTHTNNFTVISISNKDGHATCTQLDPYHILNLVWFLSSVCISSFIVQVALNSV